MSKYWAYRIGLVTNSIIAGIAGVSLTLLLTKPAPPKGATQEKISCIKADEKALTTQENGNDIEKSATSRTAKPSFFCFVPKNDI